MYEVQTEHAALTEGFVTRITSVWLRTCANLEILFSALFAVERVLADSILASHGQGFIIT